MSLAKEATTVVVNGQQQDDQQRPSALRRWGGRALAAGALAGAGAYGLHRLGQRAGAEPGQTIGAGWRDLRSRVGMPGPAAPVSMAADALQATKKNVGKATQQAVQSRTPMSEWSPVVTKGRQARAAMGGLGRAIRKPFTSARQFAVGFRG